MKQRFGQTARLLALMALSPLGACIGYDGSYQHGYVIDARTLEQVKVGASKEQVLALLGTPSTTSTVGGDAWYYISQRTDQNFLFDKPEITDQRVLAVYFAAPAAPVKQKKKGAGTQSPPQDVGSVIRIANYGMKDGKLYDFVSRTTPTGGNEPDLLRNMSKNLLRFDPLNNGDS